jgi:hypothetical protein
MIDSETSVSVVFNIGNLTSILIKAKNLEKILNLINKNYMPEYYYYN